MKYKLIAGLILLVPVLMFVQQNIAEITVRFFQWEQSISLALLLLSTLLVGVILGVLLSYFRRVKKNKKLKKAEQEKQKPLPEEPASELMDVEKTTVIDVQSENDFESTPK
ncbi:MAG: lipopolysaccharide assembly protein LapA domain-containing protein [Deltaproteobacteria bacterium]|nr:lipopolysaccharide assembly protein LapA domain-containing protein [Deltaproteobacteria bacterium]MCW8893934.1 lipopolysaccharide assembly protein LapA domain-containing protein [Deltaproteobacteria bacterium]MCW9049126.1 lipopolysaccharide assembly protein LapA domain-containing protein [Deltaproteobacteria bacterium]